MAANAHETDTTLGDQTTGKPISGRHQLGCLHYDLGEREQAEAARQAAYHAGLQTGHGEIVAWSYELAA